MTEFSQSLQLGEFTLDALDRELYKLQTPPTATDRVTRSQRNKELQQLSSAEEVIEESPTNGKCPAELLRQRSVRERLQIVSTQCRKRKVRNRTGNGNDRHESPVALKDVTSPSLLKRDNLSALFNSDLQIDTKENPYPAGNNENVERNGRKRIQRSAGIDASDGPSPEKQISLHHSSEFDELFRSSTFSVDGMRNQTEQAAKHSSKTHDYQTLFDHSEFTLDEADRTEKTPVPAAMTESELEAFSETLFDRAISSDPALDDLLETSELLQSLRVDSADDTFQEAPLNTENVTFTQPLTTSSFTPGQEELAEEGQRTALREFIENEMAQSFRAAKDTSMSNFSDNRNESSLFSSSFTNASAVTEKARPTAEPAATLSMALDRTKNLRQLANWGLPGSVVSEYAKKGIVELFPWQVECLSRQEVLLEGKNLVYSAPTSAGKTLVSEFLLAKTITERKLKALLILPFVAVAREKMLYLQDLLVPGGMRVEGFYGGYHPPGGFESVDVAVCTIEKANSIVNRLLEQSALDKLGLVVVDEVHLVSDPSRGYILELLLTKIRFVAARNNHRIQIVCMSATLPNLDLLARWLEADFYHTDFRPIALVETLKVGPVIYGATGEVVRSLESGLLGYPVPNDTDHVTQLCLETILEGCSVIVFCPSKDWCEQLAIALASTVHALRKEGDDHRDLRNRLREQLNGERQEEVLLQLRNCPSGLDGVLEKTVRCGVAFHHAGLTTDERDIIEGSFREAALRVIVATSTLSSGVNLPARRVIIRTPKFGGRPMSSLTYKQMVGRAGRTGRDTLGESVLICTPAEERIGRELIGAELPPVQSCLDSENYCHLKRAVLEIIASGSASTAGDLETFVNATLYSCERSYRFVVSDQLLHTKQDRSRQDDADSSDSDPIASCIAFLLEYEFIRLQQGKDGEGTIIAATRLGHACLAASLPPKDGFLLFSELQRARQCFVLESELHAVYLVTPYSVAYQWQQIDWMEFLDLWEKLPGASRRVGELVGVKESFMVRAMRGVGNLDYRSLQVHKRFYTALALLELVHEVPLCTVARKFRCNRGLLQSLQQTSATFAGIVASFCASLNWTLMQLIVAQFRERLFFGVAHDLLDLMRIPSLNGQRARLLHDAGVIGLVQLANADRVKVETILHNHAGFEAERTRDDENEFEAARRKRLRNLHLTGRAGMTVEEAARQLIHEARTFLQLEHGLANPNWGTPKEPDRSPEVLNPTLETVAQPEDPNPTLGEVESRHVSHSASSILLSRTDSSGSSITTNFHNPLLMAVDREEDQSDHNRDGPTIIDACQDPDAYDQFQKTVLESDLLAISVGVEHEQGQRPPAIGDVLGTPGHEAPRQRRRSYAFDDGLYLAGMAVALHGGDKPVYYVDLQDETVIDNERKERFVRDLFAREQRTIVLLDAKDQLKVIYRAGLLPVDRGDDLVLATVQDPRIACWLLQTDAETLTLDGMIERHCPSLKQASLAWRGQRWIVPKWTGFGLHHHSGVEAKLRCAVECLLVEPLMRTVSERLRACGDTLFTCFTAREMPVQLALAHSEVVGFPVDRDRLGALIAQLKACRDRIADEARKHNGNRRLDFGSSRAVAVALKLTNASDRKRCRTVRQVLERLDSPLAALVIAHRKIESNLARTIEPLYRVVRPGSDRVYGRSFPFTATGRITMHEPNLQTVVKDFTVPFDNGRAVFSCRSTFTCRDPDRTVLLSADFCQLELCILTHLSQDRRLQVALSDRKGHGDVFRSLAARWNGLEREADVNEEMRARTKAIVYGVIYGMGVRSMAAELQLDEDAARTLMEQFHSTYPDIRRYSERVVRLTRQLGYIETLTGRRRYLPAISSSDARERAEAERQAVCTTIQGSAADILKNAIVRMRRNLHRYRDVLEPGSIRLVLHLHDELIYEVPRAQLTRVAKILRSSMENCAKLSVPLRVKLKSGPSWGMLQDLPIHGGGL